MLDHLRVLDLTDERGLLCGRLLADLGADVVHVEPRGGSTARSTPPLVHDGQTSTYWETFGAGRRGVALDLDSGEGLALVRRLAAHADVLIASASPDWLRDRHLDPDSLCGDNPGLVYSAVTAFGWSGPKSDYADSDLVVWAAGGPLDPHRDGDRPPLRISVPQAFLHAAADAAAGILTAVLARRSIHCGQIVDVSAQVSVGVATLGRVLAHAVGDEHPEWHRQPVGRTDQSGSGAATPNSMKKWACKDGMVELHLSMGSAAGRFTNNLFAWLRSEGAVDNRIAAWDWRTVPEAVVGGVLTSDDLEQARAAVRDFLATKTKAEVLDAALRHRLLCMAIFDVGDIAASAHLAERGYWATVDVGGLPVRIPGRFAQVSGSAYPCVTRRAPRLGEHTEEVLRDWLGEDSRPREAGHDVGAATMSAGGNAALRGLKVLDLSWVVAGPLVGRALADVGATVVRVESSRRMETARLMQPFYGGIQDPEHSALFGNCNAGKLGVTLDLSSEEGRDVVRDLAAWADVIVESFSPGQMMRWGLDYHALSALNPTVVMLSTSIAGQSGPWSALAGFGNVGSSLSGFQHLVGWEDRLPLGPFGPYTDYLGPRIALVALLAALERRHRTGEGCYIDVAQVEAGVFFLSPQVTHYAVDGTVAHRRGNRDEIMAPHGVYPCRAENDRERFVALAVRSDEEWLRLADVIGRADLVARPDLATAARRRERGDVLDEIIAAWTASRVAVDVEHLLQSAGVPAHVSAASADIVADPQLAHRGHLVALDHPLHGTAYVEGPRFLLSKTPPRVERAAPMLGQHNEMVLREVLGYSDERIIQLAERGVLT